MTSEFINISDKERMAEFAKQEAEELWGPLEPGDIATSHPSKLYELRIAAIRFQLKVERKVASVVRKVKNS